MPRPAQYSSSCRIFGLLNESQAYVPLTSSTITTTLNRPPSDIQEKLNVIADHPTNFGNGCGVAIRNAVVGVKKLFRTLDKIVEARAIELFGFFSHKATIPCEQQAKQLENKLKKNLLQIQP